MDHQSKRPRLEERDGENGGTADDGAKKEALKDTAAQLKRQVE